MGGQVCHPIRERTMATKGSESTWVKTEVLDTKCHMLSCVNKQTNTRKAHARVPPGFSGQIFAYNCLVLCPLILLPYVRHTGGNYVK